jgi:hypothetical protein
MVQCNFCGLVDRLLGNKDKMPSNEVSRFFLYVGPNKVICPMPIAMCGDCAEYNIESGGINPDFDIEISEDKYSQYLTLD